MNSFIQEDNEGKPYMGLEIMDGITQIRVFLGYVDTAGKNVETITSTLQETVRDLQKKHLEYRKRQANGIRSTEGRVESGAQPES